MKPPRYLLREYVIRGLLEKTGPGRFLEIGYGAGDLLLLLAKLGFWGKGVETSLLAQKQCREILTNSGVDRIELAEDLEPGESFNYIFFFEVIGYWKNPSAEMARLKSRLESGGKLIFSFTNVAHGGPAEALTGEMRCFSRQEIAGLLSEAGFSSFSFINYGYPLSNWMRPLLHLYHKQSRNPALTASEAMDASGLRPTRKPVHKVIEALCMAVVKPFCWIQLLFRESDKGTGYVVCAQV
jgi:SAM-dependent methyltransferase